MLAGVACVCALALRAYARTRSARGAARRDAILHARGALRQNEILELSSPFLRVSLRVSLSKIGLAGDSGIVTPRRDRGRSGARGADLSKGAGRWSLVSAPQRPCQPWHLLHHLVDVML